MWLLQDEVAQAMSQAIKAGLCPNAKERQAFLEALKVDALNPDRELRALRIVGDVAEIKVNGVLTPQPDLFAVLFGGGNTTYADIVAALDRAQQDANVKRLVMHLDSPGGVVTGLFDTITAIENFTKPKRAVASKATSAAYALAAATGSIEAQNVSAEFGSIGVAVSLFVDDDLIQIASTEAPKKRPDPRTEQGKAVIREYLDAIHDLFVDAIARGRKVDADTVNATFGRGATLLAGDAKRLGMIDKIAKPAQRPVGHSTRATHEGDEEVETQMNLTTLKAQHPETYAAAVAEGRAAAEVTTTNKVAMATPPAAPAPTALDIQAFKSQQPELYAAVFKSGELNERDRVKAHLNLGQQCGDMKLALQAIESGEGLTLTLQSQYLSAGMNRSDRAARQAETDGTAGALDGAKKEAANDMGSIVADLVEQELGITRKKAS